MNVLFFLSDQHQRDASACYGDTVAQTPNLDAIAAAGSRYTAAYCASPICVPARAAIATGQPVCQTGHWDNAHPYTGVPLSWHHRLRAAGVHTVSIGKLHYRSAEDDYGFVESLLPLHVVRGEGDLQGLVRTPPPVRTTCRLLAEQAGPGESAYTRYDRAIADTAVRWLGEAAPRHRPWALFVSFVAPHLPLIAPSAHYERFASRNFAPPSAYDGADDHPFIAQLRRSLNYDDYFDAARLQRAFAAYYALVSFLDSNIGTVCNALERAGFAEDTLLIYTSDHGESLGRRRLWGKFTMYEESVAVPLLIAGPGVRARQVEDRLVSHLDLAPTLCTAFGVEPPAATLPSPFTPQDLRLAPDSAPSDRAVLSEYHAVGSSTAAFMVRQRAFKLVEYPGLSPQLFDLARDPLELRNLAANGGHEPRVDEMRSLLRRAVDPEAANERAFADQRCKIEAHGGVENVLALPEVGYTPAPRI